MNNLPFPTIEHKDIAAEYRLAQSKAGHEFDTSVYFDDESVEIVAFYDYDKPFGGTHLEPPEPLVIHINCVFVNDVKLGLWEVDMSKLEWLKNELEDEIAEYLENETDPSLD